MYLTEQEIAQLVSLQDLRQRSEIEPQVMDNFFDNFILTDNSALLQQKCAQAKLDMQNVIKAYYQQKFEQKRLSYQPPHLIDIKKEQENDNINISNCFAQVLKNAQLNISWYDENFNHLFFYAATHHMQGQMRWNSSQLSYLFDKNKQRELMNFWQEHEQPNSMLALANVLENMQIKSEIFFRTWCKIASNKKNKKHLLGAEAFDFVKNYTEYDLGKSYIYKIEALAIFNTEQSISLIQQEFEKQNGSLLVQEKISKILKKLGVEKSVDQINVLLQSTQEEHIVDYKYLSKEAIMKNGNLSDYQMNRFFELMQYFINSSQNKHAAKVEYENTTFFIVEKNYEVRAFKITLTNRYRFNQPESLKELEQLLRIYTDPYLKEVYPNVLGADFSSYQVKEMLYNEFKAFSQVCQLREKLNEKKPENISAPKRKI